ncbi:hypothetical protein HanLR1_Chr13g0498391 [Helianthus annuus]|nr:hypothetical protein HanLR1_Chr13g0498391 [Helianthus annuus]
MRLYPTPYKLREPWGMVGRGFGAWVDTWSSSPPPPPPPRARAGEQGRRIVGAGGPSNFLLNSAEYVVFA